MKHKWILWFLVFLLVLTTSLYYLIKSKPKESEWFSYQENIDKYSVEKYQDGFLIYDGVQMIAYDCSLDQKWLLPLAESDAQIDICGKYILVFSMEKDTIYLVKEGAIITSYASKNPICSASVNENGYACVLTADKGYKGQCLVYDNRGRLLAEYSYGDKYIVNAALSKNNRNMMLTVIYENGENFGGELLFTDIRKGTLLNDVMLSEIPSYTGLVGNIFLAADNTALKAYGGNGKEKWSYDTEGGTLEEIQGDGSYLSLCVKQGNFGVTNIVTLSLFGRLKGQYSSELPIEAIAASDGYTAAYMNNKIVLIDKRGYAVADVVCDSVLDRMFLYKNEDSVLLLSDTAVMKSFGR